MTLGAMAATNIRSVDLLLFPQFTLMGLAAAMEPLRAANRAAGTDLYEWRVLGLTDAPTVSSSGLPITPIAAFDPQEGRDALFIIASFDARDRSHQHRRILRAAARHYDVMGGIDSGSWALAAAGLLDGHAATTHWEDLEEFAQACPEVDVQPSRYVIDRGRITTSGAAPTLELMLDLIAAQHGLHLSFTVAGAFIYDRNSQANDPQATLSLGRLAVDHPMLAAAIRLMEQNISEPLSIATICGEISVARRTLETAFRNRLSTSAYSFYLDLRLGQARRMLQTSAMPVTQISDAVGFSSVQTFSRAFRRRFAMAPSSLRTSRQMPS